MSPAGSATLRPKADSPISRVLITFQTPGLLDGPGDSEPLSPSEITAHCKAMAVASPSAALTFSPEGGVGSPESVAPTTADGAIVAVDAAAEPTPVDDAAADSADDGACSSGPYRSLSAVVVEPAQDATPEPAQYRSLPAVVENAPPLATAENSSPQAVVVPARPCPKVPWFTTMSVGSQLKQINQCINDQDKLDQAKAHEARIAMEQELQRAKEESPAVAVRQRAEPSAQRAATSEQGAAAKLSPPRTRHLRLQLNRDAGQQQKRQLFLQNVLSENAEKSDDKSDDEDDDQQSMFSFGGGDEDYDPIAMLYLEPGAIADTAAALARKEQHEEEDCGEEAMAADQLENFQVMCQESVDFLYGMDEGL